MADRQKTGLEDKRILIAGGAGEVGEGIVRAFLRRGATVIVPSRTGQHLEKLRRRVEDLASGHLLTYQATLHTEDGLDELRARIEGDVGALYAAVASLGGWWQGANLPDVPLDEWNRIIANGLTSHFLIARTFIPVLARQPASSYTLINGGAALAPVPKSGPVSIVAFAQLMLQNVLAMENKGRVRVNTLLLATPVITRSRTSGPANWLTADAAGEYAVYLASRAAADVHGETIHFRDREQLDALDIPPALE
ncbi:MAG: SDR family oxidoreductase [Chloroflexota bacterium]